MSKTECIDRDVNDPWKLHSRPSHPGEEIAGSKHKTNELLQVVDHAYDTADYVNYTKPGE